MKKEDEVVWNKDTLDEISKLIDDIKDKQNKGSQSPNNNDIKDSSKRGRPRRIDMTTLLKLDVAFSMGMTPTQACMFADKLPRSTFYDWLKNNPDYSDRIEDLKSYPIMKAKTTIFQNLSDVDVAKWYVEHKCSEEFSTKQKIVYTEQPMPEASQIESILKEINKDIE